jgi:hypothetical protein
MTGGGDDLVQSAGTAARRESTTVDEIPAGRRNIETSQPVTY